MREDVTSVTSLIGWDSAQPLIENRPGDLCIGMVPVASICRQQLSSWAQLNMTMYWYELMCWVWNRRTWEVMWSDNSGDLILPGCQWQSKWVKCCKWRSWQKTWIQEWQIRCNARVLIQVMREKLLNLGDVWEQHIEIQWAKWCSEWKTKQSNSKEIVDQGSVRKSWKKYTSVGQSHTVECTPSHGFVHHDEKMDFHLYHNANGKTSTASDRWFSRVTDKDLLVMNSYPW